MRRQRDVIFLICLLLCGCTNVPVVTGDSRGYFDTAKGMYGGNEFDAQSAEGKITVANPSQAAVPGPATTAAAASAEHVAAAATAAPAPASASASASASVSAAGSSQTPIAIDPNAFAAVFGSAPNPVKPSAEQLMRLDSLSLVAGDAARVDLQKKILACRRAGETCRIAPE